MYKSFLQQISYLLLFLLAGIRGSAQLHTLSYINYDISSGLPSNNVYNCREDSCGYLWFTTDKGLLKYNGYYFKVLNTANSGLPNNDVYRTQCDRDGRLWVWTISNSFGYMENDVYHDVNLSPQNPTNRAIIFSFQTFGKIVCFVVKNSNTGYYLIFTIGDKHTVQMLIPFNYILGIDDNAKLYYRYNYSVPGKQVQMFDLQKPWLPFVSLPLSEQLPPITSSGASDFSNEHIYYTDRETNVITEINPRNGAVKTFKLPKSESVYTFGSNYDPMVLITNKKFYALDTNFRIVYSGPVRGIFGNAAQISFWYRDNCGNQWYTSKSNGIYYVQSSQSLMRHIKLPVSPDTRMLPVNTHSQAGYFVNKEKKLLYIIYKNNFLKQYKLPEKEELKYITDYDDDKLLVLFRYKTYLFSLSTGKFEHFFDSTKTILFRDRVTVGLEHNKWYHTAILPNRNQKANSYRGFMYGARYQGKGFILHGSENVAIMNRSRDSIFLDVIGHDYVNGGRYNHVLAKDIIYNNRVVTVLDPFNRKTISVYHAFLNIHISSIQYDDYGCIYILTDRDLFYLNPFKMQWKILSGGVNTDNSKLYVYKNYIILAGRFGLAVSVVNGAGNIGGFHFTANVKDAQYRNIEELWVNSNSKVILQTDKGWLSSDLDSIMRYGISGSSGIGKFTLVLNKPETKKISLQDTIQLLQPYEALRFDAVNLYGNGNVNYIYRQDGGKWQQSESGEIYPAGLKPGYHLLEVQVSDNNWRSGVYRITVYIVPYWYQQANWRVAFWIAGSILFVLSLFGIISITRFWINRADAKKQLLTDLELRAIHSQINPHFIFNTLSTALYFINRKEYENAYSHVNKFSHLLRSYLKSSHDRYVLLSEEIDMLTRYIELQQARFEHRFNYSITVDNKVPAANIQIPSLLLQPLVENAINHGLFHRREAGGLLLLSFEHGADHNELICRIEDNGIGRESAAAMKRSFDADRESYGSKLTEKLMSVFRQYEAMDIRITYVDKQAPETGTIVTLTIKNIRYIA